MGRPLISYTLEAFERYMANVQLFSSFFFSPSSPNSSHQYQFSPNIISNQLYTCEILFVFSVSWIKEIVVPIGENYLEVAKEV